MSLSSPLVLAVLFSTSVDVIPSFVVALLDSNNSSIGSSQLATRHVLTAYVHRLPTVAAGPFVTIHCILVCENLRSAPLKCPLILCFKDVLNAWRNVLESGGDLWFRGATKFYASLLVSLRCLSASKWRDESRLFFVWGVMTRLARVSICQDRHMPSPGRHPALGVRFIHAPCLALSCLWGIRL